ncbi:MAG: sulfatase [Planctomycetota bacterium]|nr:MAG: sulfatase [Planctomycetota bacterium]
MVAKNINRRFFIKSAGLGIATFSICGCVESKISVKSPTAKPNIVFIMADDLGYGELGCYGQKEIKTPSIDRLAKEGMLFTQCYAGSAVCAPARNVLMTGQHTGHTTVRGNTGKGGVVGLGGKKGRVPLKKDDVTVAEVLKKAGYVTGMTGKWGLGEPGTDGLPNDQGFDEWFGFLNQRNAHNHYPPYIWRDKEKVMLDGNKDGKETQYTHDMFSEFAIDFIKRHQRSPFFLYIPYCIPHSQYQVPDIGIYKDKAWTTDEKKYAAMVSRMDSSVGRIMDTLEKAGIGDNTYVFFCSDNGAATYWDAFDSCGPLRGRKRDAYEGGIRVPMIVRCPNHVPAATVSETVWYFADIMPTFAAIARTKAPKNIDGVNILPTLKGKKQDLSKRYLYWEFYEKDGWQAVRFGDWKGIQQGHNKGQLRPVELYNLKDDIGETNDLAAKHPELVAKVARIFKEAHVPSEHFSWKK